jgi:hypothetical protein
VATVEIYTTSTTDWMTLPAAACARVRHIAPSATAGLEVRVVAPFGVRVQGTTVSFSGPLAAVKATALLPTSDVDVIGDDAGIRTWSPPV